jgi:DNA repair exonuclease SbcCD nuclease subunit
MFRFIHAADIHLDSPLRGLERYEEAPVEEIRQATRRALERLVRLAIDEAVDFVLIAGDLYDGDSRDFKTALYFVKQMGRLREADIPVILIAGNHDAASKMTKDLRLPDNVRMLSHRKPETVHVESCGAAIHGQSFGRAAVLDDLSTEFPRPERGMFNIGLLHTSATGREGHEPYAPCTIEGLCAKQYDYWALGHVHARETLCQEPLIVFPGNIQGRHIREEGPKGCVLVTVDDRQRPHVEMHPIDVFRWKKCVVDASGIAHGDDLLDHVRQRLEHAADEADGRPLAVRIEVAGASPVHQQVAAEPGRFENEVRGLAHDVNASPVWIEKVKLRTTLPTDFDQALVNDGPVAELIQYIGQLHAEPQQLAGLAAELAPLLERLPPELTEGPDAIRLDRPEVLCEALEQVQQMLVQQLLSKEVGG